MENEVIDRSRFNGADSRFSVSNALHCMELSYLSYAGTTDNVGASEDWSITEKGLEKAGYQMRKFENKSSIYEPNAVICWDDDNVFLIFRGTEPTSWNQWATDLNLIRKSFCIGEIHRGFANSVELIWSEIMQCLNEVYIGKPNRLFVTGHSLGAGMSQVATTKLEFEENLHPTAVYNFGCPRAFNFEGADIYNRRLGTRTYRVVNGNDIVCDIPLELMGFSHVGQFKYLSTDGELWEDPSYWWLLLDGVWGGVSAIAELNLVDAVTDHLPPNYVSQLKRAM